jgi:hypothetical protein
LISGWQLAKEAKKAAELALKEKRKVLRENKKKKKAQEKGFAMERNEAAAEVDAVADDEMDVETVLAGETASQDVNVEQQAVADADKKDGGADEAGGATEAVVKKRKKKQNCRAGSGKKKREDAETAAMEGGDDHDATALSSQMGFWTQNAVDLNTLRTRTHGEVARLKEWGLDMNGTQDGSIKMHKGKGGYREPKQLANQKAGLTTGKGGKGQTYGAPGFTKNFKEFKSKLTASPWVVTKTKKVKPRK